VLKLANNNEVSFLQEKVEYLRTEINNLELKKTECTNMNRIVDDLTDIVNMYESSLNEKREEIAFLNREQKEVR
jgi:prefoldin subunit 5